MSITRNTPTFIVEGDIHYQGNYNEPTHYYHYRAYTIEFPNPNSNAFNPNSNSPNPESFRSESRVLNLMHMIFVVSLGFVVLYYDFSVNTGFIPLISVFWTFAYISCGSLAYILFAQLAELEMNLSNKASYSPSDFDQAVILKKAVELVCFWTFTSEVLIICESIN